MTEPHLQDGTASSQADDATRILYCRCAYAQVVPAAVKDAVLEGLAAAGRGFEMVPDLCEMAARRDPHLAELARGDRPLTIVACLPTRRCQSRAWRSSTCGPTPPKPCWPACLLLHLRELPHDR